MIANSFFLLSLQPVVNKVVDNFNMQIKKCVNANNVSDMTKSGYMELRIPHIGFDMPITDLIMELEKLRYKTLRGTTHPLVFMQVKSIFHMLESIGSSRIEGNNTTIMDYVESTKIDNNHISYEEEQIKEILNIERAMEYIESSVDERPITISYIRELHSLVVDGLSVKKEGCASPGNFRQNNVKISGSSHVPPDFTQVEPMMQELVDFINEKTSPKYDLLKISIAHHRFVWIHPFSNGNGRTVRLFTYAMLLKNVFTVGTQRIVNPNAVFCSNRDDYYNYLAMADQGTDEGLIRWSEYVLNGLKFEIEKIDKLVDYNYLRDQILIPAIYDALDSKYISKEEHLVLNETVLSENQELKAKMLHSSFPNKNSWEISRLIKSLVDKKMLYPIKTNSRKYVISFGNNYLLRPILKTLDRNGFLPLQK